MGILVYFIKKKNSPTVKMGVLDGGWFSCKWCSRDPASFYLMVLPSSFESLYSFSSSQEKVLAGREAQKIMWGDIFMGKTWK